MLPPLSLLNEKARKGGVTANRTYNFEVEVKETPFFSLSCSSAVEGPGRGESVSVVVVLRRSVRY